MFELASSCPASGHLLTRQQGGRRPGAVGGAACPQGMRGDTWKTLESSKNGEQKCPTIWGY